MLALPPGVGHMKQVDARMASLVNVPNTPACNCSRYIINERLWQDRAFMFDQEDREDRPYHTLPRMYMRRPSQMPLQH